jgi:hypothetical protein
MSEKYKIRDNDKAYFITSTVVGWIDLFTRPNHKIPFGFCNFCITFISTRS